MQDEGISAVVGTILIVALTVVFAAILATGVLSSSGGLQEGKVVGVTLETYVIPNQERGFTAQILGGKDAGNIQSLEVMVEGITVYHESLATPAVTDPVFGVPYNFQVSNNNYQELVSKMATVVAKFADGSSSVILQKIINLPQIEIQYPVMPISYVGTTIPGHGVNITISDPTVASNISKLAVNMTVIRDGKPEEITLYYEKSGDSAVSNPKANTVYTFYIKPADAKNPYSTNWVDGELTGTVDIYGTPKTGKVLSSIDGVAVTEGKVLISQSTRTVEARNGIADTGLGVTYSLTAKSKNNNGVYTLNSISDSTTPYKGISYVIKTDNGMEQNSFQNTQYLNNNEITWGGEAKLDNYAGSDVLEVYVRQDVPSLSGGKTFLWYKVHETTIGELRDTLPAGT